MCRIAGIISSENSNQDQNRFGICREIRLMNESMAHGGPDDEGIYINNNFTVAFGHRRLSLLDLSAAGHQPMATTDGTLVVCFNGEIYNFQEIRHELKSKGYCFRTSTDTEVILYAFQEWKEASFDKFNGMFAFALYDLPAGQVYLVRDPSGIKPLYYSIHHKQLFFSSEVKAFLQLEQPIEEQEDWRIYFLTFGFIPEPYTTLKDVFALPKGHVLQWDLQKGEYRVKSYFSFNFSSRVVHPKEAIGLVQNKLQAALQRHLIADAPIGVFLSGGIDSSILSLLAGQQMAEKVHTLSITFNEASYSEKQYQELIVKRLKGKHTFFNIDSADFTSSLYDVMQAMDQPTIDGINTYFISRCAREEGLKAVLSGLGADELLGGYPSFKRMSSIHYTQYLPSFSFKLGKYLPTDKLQKTSFLALAGDLGKYLFLRGVYNPLTVAEILGITGKEVVEALAKLNVTNQYQLLERGNFASWMETNLYMQNLLLKDSDVMSMWHGVEIRVPFLDKEFIEAVMEVDSGLKFNNQQQKWLLIAAFQELLPKEIWNRPKQGFAFPFQYWLKKHDLVQPLHQSPNKTIRKLALDFEQDKLQWSRLWALSLVETWKCPVLAD
jgi:asparagine synthase (glutamine-hydrolysing)